MAVMNTIVENTIYRALLPAGVIIGMFLQAGCMTLKKEFLTGPVGVRFEEERVHEKIMDSAVVRQKYSPLLWENLGRYSTDSRERWWRETADGEKYFLRGKRKLRRSSVVFYPMTDTNGWIGIDFDHNPMLVPIINDVVGKVIPIREHTRIEYNYKLAVVRHLFSDPNMQLPLRERESILLYDPLLFDGNRRLMFRSFIPNEQYYEYDALREEIKPVTLERVNFVKKTYDDIYRISSGLRHYWKRDEQGVLRPDYEYFRPWDPEKDAVPEWKPAPHRLVPGTKNQETE